ncbi:MAG: polymer-forming cytoskeletal protein [Geminicoccaceae bacterium]
MFGRKPNEPAPKPSQPAPAKPKLASAAPEAASKTAAPDLPKRKVELPGTTQAKPLTPTPVGGSQAIPMADAGSNKKRLIVGGGIRLNGEINACDHLVVEGEVEATLKDTQVLEILDTGHFKGGCEVDEAMISGIFDGNLTVRKRLFIHASGKVTGEISYGELEIERGGQLLGSVRVIGNTGTGTGNQTAASTSTQPMSPAMDGGEQRVSGAA